MLDVCMYRKKIHVRVNYLKEKKQTEKKYQKTRVKSEADLIHTITS